MRSDATTVIRTPLPRQQQVKALEEDDLKQLRSSISQLLAVPEFPLKQTLLGTLLKSYKTRTGRDFVDDDVAPQHHIYIYMRAP